MALARTPAGTDVGWTAVERALGRLSALRDAAVPDDLRGWGDLVAAHDGPLPLLGLGRQAPTYPGLLWNGARLARAGLGTAEGLVLTGLAAMPPEATAADLLRGVRTGLAVASALSAVVPATPVGVPTTGTVAAAACATAVASTGGPPMAEVLDVAASLMVVGPATDAVALTNDVPADRALRTGHGLAAGWLAWRLASAGLSGMPEAVAHTLTTVWGRPPTLPRPAVEPATSSTADVPELGRSELLQDLA